MPTNHEALFEHFAEICLGLKPQSVLDVGAGSGRLVRHCLAAGIPAEGIEPSGAAPDDLPIQAAEANALPFDANSFDWVAMRHVPHHLEHPRESFAEAVRVARTGLLVAEPMFDLGLEGQALAREADRWLKSLERKRGQVHGDELDVAELLELVPQGVTLRRVERLSLPTPWLADEFEQSLQETVGLEDLSEPERSEWQALRRRIEAEGMTRNGTLILELRLPESPV